MENKQVTMIRGLVRAVEGLEQGSPNGQLWDDSSRIALEIAREYGWGKHQIGTLPNGGGSEFERELEQLLNRHCQENASHTPDFILASLLRNTLDTWNLHTKERDRWFGNRSVLGPGADDKRYPPVDGSEKSLLR